MFEEVKASVEEKKEPRNTRALAQLSVHSAADDVRVLRVESQGRIFEFPGKLVGKFDWNGRVDLIGDISGSMKDGLSYDVVKAGEHPGRWKPVPRRETHELVYRAVRRLYPRGGNFVFDDNVSEFNMEKPLPFGGGTNLQNALAKCDARSITVIFTDDKGLVDLALACKPIHKMVIVVLLTSYDIADEYKDSTKTGEAAAVQTQVRARYRFKSGGTNARNTPGFGAALLSQRDGPQDLIQIVTAYNEDGTALSDQAAIVKRISDTVNGLKDAVLVAIKNNYNTHFVLQCTSGLTMAMAAQSETITVSPRELDFKGIPSMLYAHTA